jgi:hypothetical protein
MAWSDMPSTVRIATEDPLWAVEALCPLLEDYGSPVSVELDLDRGGPVVGRLTAIDQGIAILALPEGSRRLVPLERIRGIAVLIH